MPKVTLSEFGKSALTLRMITLFIGLVVVAVVCVRLGAWQLDRASERAQQQADSQAAAEANQTPQPISEVLNPGETFIGAVENQRVVVRGEYEAEGQLLVPDRILDGVTGFGVITPLRVDSAVLPVLRGWVATPEDAVPPPTGPVEVVGVLRPSEGMNPANLPQGQVPRISSADLVNRWGGPIWTGYVLLEKSDPAQETSGQEASGGGIQILPLPPAEDAGLNLQNLAYAFEWWIFGGFFALLWVRSVRDHARRRLEAQRGGGQPGEGHSGAGAEVSV